MRALAWPAVLLAASFALTFALDPWQAEDVSDIPLYRGYAELFLEGAVPYRDVGFEYPPLAAPVLAAPGLVSLDLGGYRVAFAVLALLLAVGLLAAVRVLARSGGGGERRVLLAVALCPLATGALIRTHFDLAPVLCLAAGLAAIAAGRTRPGFVSLGIGGALKLFPLAAVPVAAAWLVARGDRRGAVEGTAVAVLVASLLAAAALAVSPAGAWSAVEYHLERPVQVESLAASVLNGWEAVGGAGPTPVKSHRSDGLEHPAGDALAALLAALLLAALAGLAAAASRISDPRGLVLAGLGSAAAFATLGKVLSPQFMIWLVPLAALAWAWRMNVLAAVTSGAIALTLAWFPASYFDLVDREPGLLAAVAVRNALLLLMLALLARELAAMLRERPAAARSTPRPRRFPPRSGPR